MNKYYYKYIKYKNKYLTYKLGGGEELNEELNEELKQIFSNNFQHLFPKLEERIELDEDQRKLFKKVFNEDICKNTNENLVFTKLIDSIELITFDKFLDSIIKSFNKFIKKDDETFKDYILLINTEKTYDGTNKSNLWISLLILSLLYLHDDTCFNNFLTDNNYSQTSIIKHLPKKIQFFDKFYRLPDILKTEDYNSYLSDEKLDIDLLFCDDVSFSGTQIKDYLINMYDHLSPLKINLNFVFGYMSSHALEYIKKEFEKWYGEKNPTPNFESDGGLTYLSKEENYNEIEIKQILDNIIFFDFDRSLTIFDYKLADDKSVYHNLIFGLLNHFQLILNDDKYTNKTLIKSCNGIPMNELENKCGLAFYKKKDEIYDKIVSSIQQVITRAQ